MSIENEFRAWVVHVLILLLRIAYFGKPSGNDEFIQQIITKGQIIRSRLGWTDDYDYTRDKE